MNAGIVARLARIESAFRTSTTHYDMSGLTDEELEMLTSLPREEAALNDLLASPDYDWMPIARILERLPPAV